MSNNLNAAKAANTAYFDSTKGPNTITADQHAVLLNSTLDTAWNVPLIYEIGISYVEDEFGNGPDGYILFDNEDPLSVTSISFEQDLFGRKMGDFYNHVVVEMEDGSSVSYSKGGPSQGYSVLFTSGSPAFVIGEKVRVNIYRTPYLFQSSECVVEDAQFTLATPQSFTASTRSLLRNDGLLQNSGVNGDVIWDNNNLQFVTSEINTVVSLTIQTQFVILPSTPDITLTFEWDLGFALFGGLFSNPGYDHKKTIYAPGDPIYISEVFNVMNMTDGRVYLTGDKDFEVYGCVHIINVHRGQ